MYTPTVNATVEYKNVRGLCFRYFIKPTRQEFQLKTNLEMVEILKTLNGLNAVQDNAAA